ncbi:MAG: hypothetical protein ABIQ51_23245 [Mesorhizobium sp.]
MNDITGNKMRQKETILPPARHRADTIRADKARGNKGFGAMITAAKSDIIDRNAGEAHGRLRPADMDAHKMASQAAGPFDVTADETNSPTMRDALMTGLLVIYPALATVAAIVAGLFLAGASGT